MRVIKEIIGNTLGKWCKNHFFSFPPQPGFGLKTGLLISSLIGS
jgi:hypothetical protein